MKKSNFFSDAKLIINSEIIKNCNNNSVIFRIFNNTSCLSFSLIVSFCQRANFFSSDCTSDSHLYTLHSCHTFKKISGQILFCIWFVLSLHQKSTIHYYYMKNETGADLKSATEKETKKLFIETYGCQMNVADSEVVASIMQMAGYEVAETLEEADAVFMNTCSVRENAEQKIYNRLEFFRSLKGKRKNGIIVGVLGYMEEYIKQELISKPNAALVDGTYGSPTLPEI